LPDLNGGGTAAVVPPHKLNTTQKSKQHKTQQNKTTLVQSWTYYTTLQSSHKATQTGIQHHSYNINAQYMQFKEQHPRSCTFVHRVGQKCTVTRYNLTIIQCTVMTISTKCLKDSEKKQHLCIENVFILVIKIFDLTNLLRSSADVKFEMHSVRHG